MVWAGARVTGCPLGHLVPPQADPLETTTKQLPMGSGLS